MSRLPWLLALAFAALAGWQWMQPSPPPVYTDVIVPESVIVEVERVDTVVTWRERVVYREREPEVVATAKEGAVGLVRSFCAPTLAHADSTGGDPISPVRPTLLLRSARLEPGWFWKPDRLTVTGPLSNGDLRQFRYSVREPWQAHVRGEGMLVQTSRWWWVRELVEAGVFFGAGYAVGAW